jgi:hypothetical protein
MEYAKTKKTTMRDRDTGQQAPAWVRGKDATPEALGDDDLAWAMARRLNEKLYESGIPFGKSDAWLYFKFKAGLDRSAIRKSYSQETFTDGNGRKILLPDFGRRIIAYYWDKYPWGYESSAENVVGIVSDPVTIDEITRSLKRRYADRRARRANGNTDSRA